MNNIDYPDIALRIYRKKYAFQIFHRFFEFSLVISIVILKKNCILNHTNLINDAEDEALHFRRRSNVLQRH